MPRLKTATWILLLFLFSVSCFAESLDAAEVDPALTLVSSGFGYRVLVYTRCSPEHCWSDIYLQRIVQSHKREALCSARLTEMAYGFSVTDIEWEASDDRPRALIYASHSHGDLVHQPMVLVPEERCEYSLSEVEEVTQ